MEDFNKFKSNFVQPVPSYAIKKPGKSWKTRKFALHDDEIKKHLNHEQWVACLGRWYPGRASIDMDDVSLHRALTVQATLSLDENNSMLFRSPSNNSYHLYFNPIYNEKPPTITLLQTVLTSWAKSEGVEIYPKAKKPFRLPFGKDQDCVDFKYRNLKTWQETQYWMEKLDDFDLGSVKMHQKELPFSIKPGATLFTFDDLDEDLLEIGLSRPSSRDEEQFKRVKYLWRKNVPPGEAWALIWKWICKHHNGYSKDFLKYPFAVKKNIGHQVHEYYSRMQFGFQYPDNTHRSYNGFICKDDILNIVKLAKGKLQAMRFDFELVRYCNPRRYRDNIFIHTDKYIEWSNQRTYLKHLTRLDENGVLKRGRGYRVGFRSKGLKLAWDWKTDQDAILYKGRAVETLDKAVSMIFTPAEFRGLLRGYVARGTATKTTKTIFENG